MKTIFVLTRVEALYVKHSFILGYRAFPWSKNIEKSIHRMIGRRRYFITIVCVRLWMLTKQQLFDDNVFAIYNIMIIVLK